MAIIMFCQYVIVILHCNLYYIFNRRYDVDHLFYTHLQFSTSARHRQGVHGLVNVWFDRAIAVRRGRMDKGGGRTRVQ